MTVVGLVDVGTLPSSARTSGHRLSTQSTTRLRRAAIGVTGSQQPFANSTTAPPLTSERACPCCCCCCCCPWQPASRRRSSATLLSVGGPVVLREASYSSVRSLIQRTRRSCAVGNLLMRLRASERTSLMPVIGATLAIHRN